MRVGDKRYRINGYELEELEYRGSRVKNLIFHNQNNAEVILSKHVSNLLNSSKRMVVSELEEKLRISIGKVHSIMQEMNMKFDPINKPAVVYVPLTYKNKSVHKYDEKGFYIESYSSIQTAARENGATSPKSTIIGRACKDRSIKAYGFRWSLIKKDRI